MNNQVLKKKLYLRRGYLQFEFISDDSALNNDIVAVCNLLKQEVYIVKIFVWDELSKILDNHGEYLCKRRNFSF